MLIKDGNVKRRCFCREKDTILKCLAEMTPECPSDYIQMQNGYLQGYLGMGCNFVRKYIIRVRINTIKTVLRISSAFTGSYIVVLYMIILLSSSS